ncbi:MAG: TonB-dependent receptor [Microscillaceae bacterium]|jgi:iron complex outermembrane receptor protein|nr:TonB-dependent receptor [Microscillaceae bacterium]
MNKFLLLFIFSIWGQSLIAQSSFSGRVYDAETQLALSAVSISQNNRLLAVSDSAGFFSFTLANEDSSQIQISKIGYQTQTLVWQSGVFQTIYLQKLGFQLNEIIVQGYENNRPLLEVAAAIATLKPADLERFNNASIVSAMNTLPGVRMEERSPGSFRLAIRGSALRSPFNVRNVKMYWNDMPLTDAGGNTYLNGLDFNNLQNIEVIKGPGASLYGAGTGGVVLLQSPQSRKPQTDLQITSLSGSYGLFGVNGVLHTTSQKQSTRLMYAHQQADGYREQTQMRRDVINWQSQIWASEKRTLNFNVFYSDLYYQTPGGLTNAQFLANPRQARPATPVIRGAVEQQAAIALKTFYGGVSQEYQFNAHWSNRTAIYFTYNQVENPSIRNYERRIEPGFGGRSVTNYQFMKGKIKGKVSFGGEFQYGFNNTRVFGNRLGQSDTLQTDDEIRTTIYNLFAQTELDLPQQFYVTIGGSYNQLIYNYLRLSQVPNDAHRLSFVPVFSPRIALLKKIKNNWSIYGSLSRGFSPPTIAEVRPSEGSFNRSLQPEKGTNYEIGIRGNWWQNKIQLDLTGFALDLQETIVVRRTQDGADFFVNAGNTRQRGLEASLAHQIIKDKTLIINDLRFFLNYTYNDFRFKNYQKQAQQLEDFSGNWLTGVAPHIAIVGLDLQTNIGFYLNFTYNFTDRIPLNDANTFFASGYRLLGGRVGYRKIFADQIGFEVWLGIDNALNEAYSLGNDLNAVGNRFFNPAADRNFFGGLRLQWIWKKQSKK